MFVIDVAGGDKVPRKGGPGVTRSDLLVINKVDLADHVGADLEVMESRRPGRPQGPAGGPDLHPDRRGCGRRPRSGGRVVGPFASGVILAPEVSVATLRLRAHLDGSPVVQEMHSSGALAFRPTAWGVWMVGTAAFPIAGDKSRIRLALGPDCRAEIRSVGATIARRGLTDRAGPSSTIVVVRVGAGASLIWSPEPGVAAVGSHHETEARVWLATAARLAWRDEWTLGRYGEEPGTWRSRTRITMAGRPLLASDLATGPAAEGWPSRSVLGGARAVSSLTLVDPGLFPAQNGSRSRASFGTATGLCVPLSGPAVQIMTWGGDLLDCRATVARLLEMHGLSEDLPTVVSPSAPKA